MAQRSVFDRVRKIGLELPDVEEGTSYGAPALKVGGKMFVCVPSHKSAEPDSIAARVSFLERDLRMSAEPSVYYLKPHYEGYEVVLVRVKLLSDASLRELLETAREFVAPKRKPRAPRSRRT